FSLVVIWIMLLYHMFLMLGGYLHFLRFGKVIPIWKQKMKGELPKVSILIPAHNEAVVIETTLNAMIRLNYPTDKLEVIVINDNSSDQTGEIARKIGEDYSFIKVVDTIPPYSGIGKSSALNYGFKESVGKYIVVYDADNTPEQD